jgi:hypothetical protein
MRRRPQAGPHVLDAARILFEEGLPVKTVVIYIVSHAAIKPAVASVSARAGVVG